MKVSRSRTDAQRALLSVVPTQSPDNDVISKAPAVELRRATDPCGEDAGDGNVVSLAHVRAERDHGVGGHAAPPLPPAAPEDRPVPSSQGGSRRRSALMAGCSAIIHAALLAAFAQEPAPVASIGLEVIAVEMVLGADAPAGMSPTPGESETVSAAATGEPEPDPDQKPPEEKAEEPPPPTPVEEAKAPEPEPAPEEPPVEQEVALAPPPDPVPEPPKDEPPPPEPAPVIEKEAPETVAAIPPPEPPKPQPQVKPEVKPVAKPKPKAKTEPKKRVAARTDDNAKTRTTSSTSSVASSAASGLGRGRSDNNTNYRGIVAAHLARHKQFPSDARASGHQGATSVSFSIDGSGRVTSVRLGRSSGVSSLDQETTAMVRRASPFPAPPSGQGMSFSVPVSFFLR